MPTPPAIIQDFLDFLPLFPEDDEDAILARMREWANEGLDPANPGDRWADTREGSHWYTAVMPAVRELARLYDLAGSEVVMAGMLLWTWGRYLDDEAAVQQLARLPATAATGIVTFTGPEGTTLAAGTQVGVNPATPDDPAPLFQTTEDAVIPAPVLPATLGVIDVPIVAVEPGSASNVPANSVTSPSTPLPPNVSFTNAEATLGGTEPETDEALRARILQEFVGHGGGNVQDYVRWAEEEPGVGHATCIPIWNGPGTVLVIVTDPAGDPVPTSVVDSLQARLDPVPGQGAGEAPIGHTVTVNTATALNINVVATIRFEPYYSLDGTGGTVALRGLITDAVRGYVESVQSGGEVVVAQIEGAIVTVPGVHDVTALTVNGGGANVPVPAGASPKTPILNALTLTEAP